MSSPCYLANQPAIETTHDSPCYLRCLKYAAPTHSFSVSSASIFSFFIATGGSVAYYANIISWRHSFWGFPCHRWWQNLRQIYCLGAGKLWALEPVWQVRQMLAEKFIHTYILEYMPKPSSCIYTVYGNVRRRFRGVHGPTCTRVEYAHVLK